MIKYKYRNTKTGATIRSSSKIRGKNWVEITDEVEVKEETVKGQEVLEEVEEESLKGKEEVDDIDGVTKKEIMQELDAMGIKYNPRATKKELYDLMMQGR